MNERKLKQLNLIVVIAAVVGVLCMGIFTFFFAPDGQNKITTGKPENFSKDWVLRNYKGQNDMLITLPAKLDYGANDIVTIMRQVPEGVTDDTALFFETEFQNVVVDIGELRVYSYGVMNNQKLTKTAVPCQHVVSLAGAKPGDVIAIYFSSGYDKYSGRLPSIKIGSRGDIVSGIILGNGAGFVFALTLIAITIVLFVGMMLNRKVEIDRRRSAYAFSFVIAAALWSLTSNPIMQLLTKNAFGLYMSSMVLLLLLPILYLMHLRCFAVKKRFAKIFEIGIYVFSVFMLTGIVFQMLYVLDFATYIVVTKVMILIGLIVLAAIMYLAADVYTDKSIVSNLLAHMVLTVSCVLEAVLSLFKFYKKSDGLVLSVGLYIFLVMLMITAEKAMAQEVVKERDDALSNVEEKKELAFKHINSRFIYSTLGTAMSSLRDTDPENSRLIYNTSVYMKYNMQTIQERTMVPFIEELSYIKAYLGMQEKNHPGLSCSVEDKIVEFSVPFNTVEPLVENAVKNGALSGSTPGKIVIRSYERLDCFAIQIVDNGVGIGPDKKFTGKTSFKEIRRVLKTKCGGAIEVKTKPDKGTIVTVKIPKKGYEIKE